MSEKIYHTEKDLKKYIQNKLEMLEYEFFLKLTPLERYHFHELKTHLAVDQYAHTLLRDKL